MDFSVAIKLKQEAKKEMEERLKDPNPNLASLHKKDTGTNLSEFYRNAGQAHFELAQYV